MPSARPSAPIPSARVALTDTGAPSTALEPVHHGSGVRCQARRVGDDRAVRVGAGEPLLGGHLHHRGQQGHAVRPLPDRVGVGEVPAEVSQADGTEHGVGQRVAHRVGVTVAPEAACALDDDAAQHERPVRVLGEAVDVDPLADAHGQSFPDARWRSAARRSSGVVILKFPGSPGTTRTAAPSASTSTASSVASGPACSCGAPQRAGPERLGRLDGDESAAVQRAGDVAGVVHRLDGVTQGDAGHGPVCSPVGDGTDHGREEGRRRQRPRRVVHDDHLGIARDDSHAATDGVGACRATRHDRIGTVGVRFVETGGEDEHDAGGRRPAGVDGPFDHRAAGEGGELLRPPEATPGAPGNDDRPHLRHGATGPVDQVSASFRRSSAVSSSTLSAKVSSDTRIWRARCSIRFSPADRPLSLSRMDRFRTTSATW